MKVQCKFTLKYPNPEIAKKIKDALEVDNYRFIQTEQNKEIIEANINSESVMSLLHTIEDYLSCLAAAENVVNQTEKQLKKEKSTK